MIQTKQIFSQHRVAMAVLGVTKEEFNKLLPTFSQCLKDYRMKLRPNRKRKLGGGRKGDLPTDEHKLLYILLYLKLYPTYDALAVLTNHHRSKCGDSVKLLLPVLEMTLGRKLVLPKRPRGNSLEEIFRQHPEIKDIFIDGTERRVQRSKNLKKRNRLYSGKKKATTRKTVVMNDEKKYIHYMSKTKSGRRHDKRIADKEGIWYPGSLLTLLSGQILASKEFKNSMITLSCRRKQQKTILLLWLRKETTKLSAVLE